VKKEIKMIASDMDGTLLNNERKVTGRNAEILKQAQAQGIKVIAATGRDYKEASHPLREAGLSMPVIGANGAEFRSESGGLIDEKVISEELYTKISHILDKEQAYFEIYTNFGAYTRNREEALKLVLDVLHAVDSEMSKEEALGLAEQRFAEGGVRLAPSYNAIIEAADTRLLKVLAFSASENARLQVRSALQKLPLDVSSSGLENIEITHKEATKGKALKRAASFYGISLDETLVIGDNENDLSMIEAAGYSAAMGNAVSSVKEAADFITANNEDSGVAEAVLPILKRVPLAGE
jgi:Cof subfamily protein (haloacid dehalogenase superfamily)